MSRAAENVSMPIAFSSGPASKARRSGMRVDEVEDGRAAVSSPTTRTSPVERVARGRRARRPGTRWKAATTCGAGRRGLHLGGDRARAATAPGRTGGLASRGRWPSRSTTLPASCVGVGLGGRHRGVPHGGEHDEVGVGGVVVGAGLEAGDPVAPALAQLVDDLRRPVPVTRPDDHPVAGRRQPGRDPPPRRPGPPQHPDVHARELRTRPTRPPHPPSRTSQGSRAHTPANLEMLEGA